MTRTGAIAVTILASGALAVATGCGGATHAATNGLPKGSERVKLDPAEFTAQIDNPYWPMPVGARWVYREGATQRVEVTVLSGTEQILGIDSRVVHDVVSENGKVVEDTYDWYAQDRKGNIWYMREDTKEYGKNGSVDTAGSWRGGVNGAHPGVIVPAEPKVGASYRQEYLEGEAEDNARNMSVDEQVGVPQGHYDNVFMTRETTPLEPKLLEYKFYARGVGPILAVAVSPEPQIEELISFGT
jgi:hypothetical protein